MRFPKIVLAACGLNENVCVPLELIVVGEADINAGRVHAMLPIPEPDPENVQVVAVQDTPAPVNVKAPVALLMLFTPADGDESQMKDPPT